MVAETTIYQAEPQESLAATDSRYHIEHGIDSGLRQSSP